MPEELVYKIIDQLDWNCMIQWGWIGEPLCDKRLFKFMDYAATKGIPGFINTNGSLINEESAERLMKQKGLGYINVAIDSVDPAKYEMNRRGLSYKQVEYAVRLLAHKQSLLHSNVAIYVANVDIPGLNDGEYSQFRDHWCVVADNYHSPLYRLRGGDWDKKIKQVVPNKNCCKFIIEEMNISTDGLVPLCPCDAKMETIVGSAWDTPLKDLWFCKQRIDTVKQIEEHGLPSLGWCRETELSPDRQLEV
jgi:hypothetical protein